jgi:hypothetical protein
MFSWKHTERSAFTQTAQLLRFPFSKVNLVVLPNKRDSTQVHMRGDPAWYFPAPLPSTTVRRRGYAGHLRVSRDVHNCRTQVFGDPTWATTTCQAETCLGPTYLRVGPILLFVRGCKQPGLQPDCNKFFSPTTASTSPRRGPPAGRYNDVDFLGNHSITARQGHYSCGSEFCDLLGRIVVQSKILNDLTLMGFVSVRAQIHTLSPAHARLNKQNIETAPANQHSTQRTDPYKTCGLWVNKISKF